MREVAQLGAGAASNGNLLRCACGGRYAAGMFLIAPPIARGIPEFAVAERCAEAETHLNHGNQESLADA